MAARYTFPVALYTDCLSLLQAVTSSRNTGPHVLEVGHMLSTIKQAAPVNLYHLYHAGIFAHQPDSTAYGCVPDHHLAGHLHDADSPASLRCPAMDNPAQPML
ncbi:hypothetical protein MTO96_047263 [Rhipicephalus appendiculatus]